MIRQFFLFLFLALSTRTLAQPAATRLARAWERFENDSQLHAAIASICVEEAGTGKVVFEKNSHTGLAPASTQKVITAATAYEVLGADFRFQTRIAVGDTIVGGALRGPVYILGNGDPTLGSWRYAGTDTNTVLRKIAAVLKGWGIRSYTELLLPSWRSEVIPPGWIWEDLGQYYGAGAGALNWHENQFDLELASAAALGGAAKIVAARPAPGVGLQSEVTTAAAGSGDQTYFYPANNGRPLTIRGTIPVNQSAFKVSGSLPAPASTMAASLRRVLEREGIKARSEAQYGTFDSSRTLRSVYLSSPPLDSITYWFLRKSINLYGEALLKAIAAGRTSFPDTRTGAAVLKKTWKERGVDALELNIRDGSGLSPENRVSTGAQVRVLQYARKQTWFGGYYSAFPEYNGMKMKSGTISGVKAFCGYHKSKDGNEYTFSFIVNNYNGRESAIIQKMYAVLNELK